MTNKGMLGTAGLAVAVVLFVALNALSGDLLRSARLDLTEQGLYTLSQGTRNILTQIDEPITLRFYYSRGLTEQVPEIVTYANRVQELLEEYVQESGGKLRLEVIEPAPFSEEEDEAVAAGVQGVPIPPAGDLFSFGLVAVNATDETAVIPFFDPSNEAFLEYELSRFIHKLSHPERPRLGVLSALPVQGGPPPQFPGAPPGGDPWYLFTLLGDQFDVEYLPQELDVVPDDVDVLAVIHPKGFGEDTLYAIDQFVLGGGAALVMVDPHSEEDRPPSDPSNPLAGMGTPRGSDLAPLLAAWGVEYDSSVLLGDRASALYVSSGAQARPERTPYVAWVDLGGDCLDADDPATAGLGALRLAAAGVLSPVPGATTRFTPLVRSSDDACELEVSTIQFFPQPKDLLASFAPTGQRYTVAARVTGPCSSAYPDGRPSLGADEADDEPDEEEQASSDEHLTASKDSIHVVVVADADMAADGWWVQFQSFFGARIPTPTSSNGDFLLNVLDSLSGSSDLVEVRGRGRSERPFERIEALRRQAEQRYLAEEQRLQDSLRDTEKRLNDLQSQRDEAASLILTPEQAAEIERFQDQRVATRKALRAVKHELSKDIEGLKDSLMFANTLGMPLLVLLAALGAWFARGRQG